jgi:hypothetical protein
MQGLGGAFFILLFDPMSSARSVLNVVRLCALSVGRGVSAACFPSDGAVVAFGDCTSPSSSSTSIVSTSEVMVAVSADTADLVRFPSSSSPPRPGSRPRRRYLPGSLPHASRRGDLGRLLTDKRRIPLRFASVRSPHLFHHGIAKVLVNRGARGLQAFNLLLRTSY